MDKYEFAERAECITPRMYRIALLHLGNEASAADAVAEAVYRGLISVKKLREPAYFETWMARILINECNKIWRRLKREQPSEELPEPADEEKAFSYLPLKEAIYKLPSQLKEVEHGYVQTVGLEQRVGDSTLRVEHIIKDGQLLHIFLTLDPPAYDYMSISASAHDTTSISIIFIRDQYAIEFHEMFQVTLRFRSAVPQVVNLSGDVLDFGHNTDGSSTGRSIGEYSFNIFTD